MLALRLDLNVLPWRKGLGHGAWVGDPNFMRASAYADPFLAQAPTPQAPVVLAADRHQL